MNNQRGSVLLLALILTVALFLVGGGIFNQIQNVREASFSSGQGVLIQEVQSNIDQLLSDPGQCPLNFVSVVRFPVGSNPAATVFTIPKFAIFDEDGNELQKIAETGTAPVGEITVTNLRSTNASKSNWRATLTVNWIGSRVARKAFETDDFNLIFSMSGGNYRLSNCSLHGGIFNSTYKGILIGTAPLVFTKTWNTPLANETKVERHSIAIEDYPSARMVDINSVCTVSSDDAGSGTELIVYAEGVQVVRMNVCYIWGVTDSRMETFQAGRFFELPRNATELVIVFTADAGAASGGDYWYNRAEVAFFE